MTHSSLLPDLNLSSAVFSTEAVSRPSITSMRIGLFVSALVLLLTGPASAQIGDGTFPAQSNLMAGSAKIDITPENAIGMQTYGHPRIVDGVRDPLKAGVLILDDGETKAAIVTTDLINAYSDMVRLIRERIEEKTGVPAANIMVTASHNHSGPKWDPITPWGRKLIDKIGDAATAAAGDMRMVTVGYGEDEISFGINRRKVINGQAVVRLNPDGPNDPRVKVLRFDDGKSLTPVAVLMHAVCHPCFFTWGDKGSTPYPNGYPKMTADFPGDAQTFVEMVYGNQTNAMFLQGCAGDIRPNLPGYPYRCADEADIQWAGRDLGCAVTQALARGVTREELSKRESFFPIRVASKEVELPGKEGTVVKAELMAMKIGPYLLLSMPGEPMVEYGFKLEGAIADRAIPIIVGYANGGIGYIATEDSYEVGGYEPERSVLMPSAETVILEELGGLADMVIGDVFKSFSKHQEDIEKRDAEEKARLENSKKN
ncbi:MAG: neutral ceramidase [Verrucomicrobiales bacterium]|jgi:neutral ceramidase